MATVEEVVVVLVEEGALGKVVTDIIVVVIMGTVAVTKQMCNISRRTGSISFSSSRKSRSKEIIRSIIKKSDSS